MSDADDIMAVSMGGFDTRIDSPSPKFHKIEFENNRIEMRDMSNTENPIASLKGAQIVPHSKKLQNYLEGDEIKGVIVYQKCKTCNYDTCVLDTWDECDKICGNCEEFKEKQKTKEILFDVKFLKDLRTNDNFVARGDKEGNIIIIKQ